MSAFSLRVSEDDGEQEKVDGENVRPPNMVTGDLDRSV